MRNTEFVGEVVEIGLVCGVMHNMNISTLRSALINKVCLDQSTVQCLIGCFVTNVTVPTIEQGSNVRNTSPRWEYAEFDPETSSSSIADIGRDGWELVAVNKGKFYFKRPGI